MTHERIMAEMVGRPTLHLDGRTNDRLTACLVVQDHPRLPDLLFVELRGAGAAAASNRLGPDLNQVVLVDLWTSPHRDPDKAWPIRSIEPAFPDERPAPPPTPRTAPGHEAMHDQLVEMYVRPVVEVLAGVRPPSSLTALMDPSIGERFARLAKPIGHGQISIRRTIIQAGYPRIDITAAARIGERTHPVALGLEVAEGGAPRYDAVVTPRLRLRSNSQRPLAVTTLATTTRAVHQPPNRSLRR